MRKFIIGISAFFFIVLLFLAYALFMDTTPPIELPKAHEVQDLDLPETQERTQQTDADSGIIEDVKKVDYYKYNPDTNKLESIYGFDKLVNPNRDSSRWEVERPYLILFRSNYKCRIDSDTGTFQMERAGSSRTPKDAQLDGNVVIHIIPTPTSKIAETYIYMDDLNFSSERSEFTTDGPVKIDSEEVMLDGYGMDLFFDTLTGRIDFMRIQDLKELRIFESVPKRTETGSLTAAAVPEQSPVQPQPEQTPTVQGAQSDIQGDSTGQPTTEEQPVSPDDFYQCILKDNVEIEYGDKLVVAGADEVNIQNIIFSGVDKNHTQEQKAGSSQGPAVVTPQAPAPESVSKAAPETVKAEVQPDKVPESPTNLKSREEVVVRCDGGIIFKPMNGVYRDVSLADTRLSIEMSGNPLKIDRISTDALFGREPLVSCGLLTYSPVEDILRLFTHERQPEIVLNSYQSQSYIQTLGNVWWNRKSQKANIAGPGKAFLVSSDSSKDPTEISFKGAMDLMFADVADLDATPTIQTVNLTGGMAALFKQNVWYKTIADSATLNFKSRNLLSQAHLLGQVQFRSIEEDNPKRAASDSAVFVFGPENSLSTAYMQGKVMFESTKDEKLSRALADAATFHFDRNEIQTAEMKGAVRFLSDTGKLTSSQATIEFEPDESGAMQPRKMRTMSKATLETVSDTPQSPPAKFQARKIDYDLQTGSGLAHGPVRFRFYQLAGGANKTVQPWVPVTVTADENAQFIADATGTVKQVVFNGNVLASRNQDFPDYVQLDDLHGEKLTVDLDEGNTESLEISRITMSEGNVYAQSQQMKDEQIYSNVKLYCEKIVFNDKDDQILAQGPGKIEMDNSRITASDESSDSDMFDIRKPCYIFIEGFDSIDWDLTKQKIVAEGNLDQLQLVYIPLVNGTPDKFIYVNSLRFDLLFGEDALGKTTLERVYTDRTIYYTEKDNNNKKTINWIIGQKLDYDRSAGAGWLKIEGTPSVPCNVNGSRHPYVYVNPKTGKIETKLSTIPGVLRNQNESGAKENK